MTPDEAATLCVEATRVMDEQDGIPCNRVEYASKELAKAAREVRQYYAAGVGGGKTQAAANELKMHELMTRKERRALARMKDIRFVPVNGDRGSKDNGWN